MTKEQTVQVVDDKWYTLYDGTIIGIVTINTGFTLKRYIGIGAGIDREQDITAIATRGTPFYG